MTKNPFACWDDRGCIYSGLVRFLETQVYTPASSHPARSVIMKSPFSPLSRTNSRHVNSYPNTSQAFPLVAPRLCGSMEHVGSENAYLLELLSWLDFPFAESS